MFIATDSKFWRSQPQIDGNHPNPIHLAKSGKPSPRKHSKTKSFYSVIRETYGAAQPASERHQGAVHDDQIQYK